MSDLLTEAPATYRIVVPAPTLWLTANQRLNRWTLAERVRTWRSAAYTAALRVRPKVPTGLDRVRLDVTWRFARKPVRDLPNLAPTLKAIVDGALGPKRGTAPGYGLVADDSDTHLVYGAQAVQRMALPPARAALAPWMGEVVLDITDLGGAAC